MKGNGLQGSPFLYVFDSLPGDRSEQISNIREYLSQEWEEKVVNTGSKESKSFSNREMILLEPKKPVQDNLYDCGIFLITYVEKIFQNLYKFVGRMDEVPTDLSSWFSSEEVYSKRKKIETLIFDLAESQNPANLERFKWKRRKASSSEENYGKWLQNLIDSEFHFYRGCADTDELEEGSEGMNYCSANYWFFFYIVTRERSSII